MGIVNTLLHGRASDVVLALDGAALAPHDLQVALINAFRRIDVLEREQRILTQKKDDGK